MAIINPRKMAEIVYENLKYVGSSEWNIYANTDDGWLDCRHNTESNGEWIKIVNFYSFWNDRDTLDASIDELADWLPTVIRLPDGFEYGSGRSMEIPKNGWVFDEVGDEWNNTPNYSRSVSAREAQKLITGLRLVNFTHDQNAVDEIEKNSSEIDLHDIIIFGNEGIDDSENWVHVTVMKTSSNAMDWSVVVGADSSSMDLKACVDVILFDSE